MKVVSIINNKGGVGKTTLTANIGAEIANRNKRVLLIDLDPQTNLTFSFIKVDLWKSNFAKNRTIKFWFDLILDNKSSMVNFEDLIYRINNLDIIFSHTGLTDLDVDLASKFSNKLTKPTERQLKKYYVETYSYLRNELKKLKDRYDIVLIDCPPSFGMVTKNAIIASDYYLIPAKMDYLSTLGINQLRNRVCELVQIYNNYCTYLNEDIVEPKFLGVVATMVSIRNNELISAQKAFKDELIRSGIDMFKSMIRENKTIYAISPEYGIPVVLNNCNSGIYGEVKREWIELVNEFLIKVGVV
ncbi:ParA family protein [Thermobrachium celere]|uniref:Cobyrinic acid a,c-diamide synthase n=2 Tax=Thermobrachium TaxID=150333 RepID=R7RQB3_9CLOT|nr:ParA family protein [Thermobrachium celere]CDF58412.1 Cobyrinic acid a,c-diamide synthase [Thermobrachium celere DSM 8682]